MASQIRGQIRGQIPFLTLIIIFFSLLFGSGVNSDDVTEIIKQFGYPSELHSVTTNDGYILGIHRIPFSSFTKYSKNSKREPVLMMHGLLSSSADWVAPGRQISLALQLSDAGYDVWMGNARGNTYSKKHISLNTKSDEFWNFSMDEIGKIDVPASIDYILNRTNQTSLFSVGNSQGTIVFLIALSTLPKYNPKIKTLILLAPPAYMKNFPNPLYQIKIFNPIFQMVSELTKTFEFLPKSDFQYIRQHCNPNDKTVIIFQICDFVLHLISGQSEHMNTTLLSRLAKTFPAGASSKQIVHFSQLIMSGKFQSFDYKANNLKRYGQIAPPEYKLYKVNAPVALFYGMNDNLVSVEDAENIAKDLKNVFGTYKIKGWNHLDLTLATNTYKVVNSKILRMFGRFSGK